MAKPKPTRQIEDGGEGGEGDEGGAFDIFETALNDPRIQDSLIIGGLGGGAAAIGGAIARKAFFNKRGPDYKHVIEGSKRAGRPAIASGVAIGAGAGYEIGAERDEARRNKRRK